MSTTKTAARVTHHIQLGVTDETEAAEKHVKCVFSVDGKTYVVFGPEAEQAPHPELRLSVSNQDDVVWSSDHPFRIDFDPRPNDLFFRPLPWKSVKGTDNVRRVHSGALDPRAIQALRKQVRELKFIAEKLVEDDKDVADDEVKTLDPHFIVEP